MLREFISWEVVGRIAASLGVPDAAVTFASFEGAALVSNGHHRVLALAWEAMNTDEFGEANDHTKELIDVRPEDERWGHGSVIGPGDVTLHHVRRGAGSPVVLLHGWPGFWYDWRRVIPALAPEADVVAPDFRGFGDSGKPELAPAEGYTAEVLAMDVLALLDGLGLERVVIAAHDIGATVAQLLGRRAPERIRGLVLLNPPYPGIGKRRFEPAAQREFWYQHFHNLPWADRLVAHDRETVRLYLAHFYDHWAGRKDAIRPRELEAIVDVYVRPGAVRASIAYYRARAATRAREASASPERMTVDLPTYVLWGEEDPVIPVAWSDRLAEFFPRLRLQTLPGVGHFVPVEAPDDVVEVLRRALSETGL